MNRPKKDADFQNTIPRKRSKYEEKITQPISKEQLGIAMKSSTTVCGHKDISNTSYQTVSKFKRYTLIFLYQHANRVHATSLKNTTVLILQLYSTSVLTVYKNVHVCFVTCHRNCLFKKGLYQLNDLMLTYKYNGSCRSNHLNCASTIVFHFIPFLLMDLTLVTL